MADPEPRTIKFEFPGGEDDSEDDVGGKGGEHDLEVPCMQRLQRLASINQVRPSVIYDAISISDTVGGVSTNLRMTAVGTESKLPVTYTLSISAERVPANFGAGFSFTIDFANYTLKIAEVVPPIVGVLVAKIGSCTALLGFHPEGTTIYVHPSSEIDETYPSDEEDQDSPRVFDFTFTASFIAPYGSVQLSHTKQL